MSSIAIHFVQGATVVSFSSLWPYIAVPGAIILVLLLFFLIRSRKKETVNRKLKKQPVSQNIPQNQNMDTQKILNALQKSPNPVLLAANNLTDLPVTIPVNLAVSLAKKGKCLLIDLDSKRDALAKVFEVDSSIINRNLKIAPVQTEFENLAVWPAQYFDLLKQMNLRSLLDSSEEYEHILLYAPYLTVLADRKQIASCSKHAVIFCNNSENNKQLRELLKACNCKILLEA